MGAGERSPGFAPGQLCAGPAAPSTREAPAEDIAAVGVGAVLLGTSEIVIVNKKKVVASPGRGLLPSTAPAGAERSLLRAEPGEGQSCGFAGGDVLPRRALSQSCPRFGTCSLVLCHFTKFWVLPGPSRGPESILRQSLNQHDDFFLRFRLIVCDDAVEPQTAAVPLLTSSLSFNEISVLIKSLPNYAFSFAFSAHSALTGPGVPRASLSPR